MKFAFFKGTSRGLGGLLDRSIRWFMRGSYSHVEAILADNLDGTYLVASSVPGTGVRIATITLAASDYDIVEGPGDAEASKAWFDARVGKPYNYLGLLGFVIRPATGDDRNKFWCSEACLESIGYPGAWREDPNSMFDIVTFSAGCGCPAV